MRRFVISMVVLLAARAVGGPVETCPRPDPGSAIVQPTDLRSRSGVLRVDLALRDSRQPDGSLRYCFIAGDGSESPTLRLQRGDLLILRLKNELTDLTNGTAIQGRHVHGAGAHHPGAGSADARTSSVGTAGAAAPDPCHSGIMSAISTNLHFHGMNIASSCHQDDVLRTSIQPGDPPFEYRFRIPRDEPPGLYWYHPHIHGFTKAQVVGGASGALIVEGLERANAAVAGLPERVLVIRDQDLLHPDSPPSKSEPVVPKMMIDRDGDSANNGTGFGKPAKDLSVNFVPVPFPDYPPARMEMQPAARELWRVLNASSVTYLNLALLFGKRPQMLGIVGIDGVPLDQDGRDADAVQWQDHIGVPPGARTEFIATAPPAGASALWVTRTVDTGQGGENDPNRALALITADSHAHAAASTMPRRATPFPKPALPWLGDVPAVRTRKLYFSEKLSDPGNPNSATEFYLTVDGQTPAPFDPASTEPNIVVKQGDVEDWIVENRSTELHAFHIHQLHFLLTAWSGTAVHESFLRDTVNVPYYNGRMLQYPSVTLRMDFRGPNVVGTFMYHCHLLEHEDGGMMGLIRVEPSG